jgi:hypothetical protein
MSWHFEHLNVCIPGEASRVPARDRHVELREPTVSPGKLRSSGPDLASSVAFGV